MQKSNEQSVLDRAALGENAEDTAYLLNPSPAAKPRPRLPRSPIAIGLIMFLLGASVSALILTLRQRAASSVMTVNGAVIDQQTFMRRMELAAGLPVARQMRDEELKLQFAQKMGVLPTEEEVEVRYTEASKQPDFAKNLAASRQTPEDFKRSLRVNMAEMATLNKDITVNDADIQNFYKFNSDPKNPQARYLRPESVTIAVIVSEKQDDIKNALHDLASGTAFADVARKFSKDQSAANGGLLPAFRRGQADPQKFPGMEAILFAMKPGEQREMVKVGNGWWIIRCLERTSEVVIPFEQVRDECRTGATIAKGLSVNGAKMQAAFAQFKKEADVRADWPQYKDVAVEK